MREHTEVVNGERIRTTVRRALEHAGAQASLIGYDANGIQELVTASSRSIAMQGASQTILDFDDEVRKRPGTIFAGGGRGTLAVSQDATKAMCNELSEEYRRRTYGGVLAITDVPLSDDIQGSLTWLGLRLGLAKDAAPPPSAPVPRARQEQCSDCNGRRATRASARRDPGDDRICDRCYAMVAAGRSAPGHERSSLEEISTKGRVAVVSADGNNLGGLFGQVTTLEEMAVASEAVGTIFRRAHEDAVSPLDLFVAPVTGGDDIRVFLPPDKVIGYVGTLAEKIASYSEAVGELDGLASSEISRILRNLGIGVGVVIADHHFPAARLVELAHEVELSAKKRCRADGTRSAVDFVLLKSGQELIQGLAGFKRSNDPRPFVLGDEEWQRWIYRARELMHVPGSQRALALPGPLEGLAEHLNFFRAQVARSAEWQQWFQSCDIDWRNRRALDDNLPGPALLELAEIMEIGQ